jgi:hypothetical protein
MSLYVLGLEFIGESTNALLRAFENQVAAALGEDAGKNFVGRRNFGPWVAQITGIHEQFTFERQFIRGQKDYSRANSQGSRGVFLYFHLGPGLYEAKQHLSWRRTRRFFFRIDNEELTEMTKEDMLAAVKADLSKNLPY